MHRQHSRPVIHPSSADRLIHPSVAVVLVKLALMISLHHPSFPAHPLLRVFFTSTQLRVSLGGKKIRRKRNRKKNKKYRKNNGRVDI